MRSPAEVRHLGGEAPVRDEAHKAVDEPPFGPNKGRLRYLHLRDVPRALAGLLPDGALLAEQLAGLVAYPGSRRRRLRCRPCSSYASCNNCAFPPFQSLRCLTEMRLN